MIDFACKRFDLDEIIRCGLGLTKSDLCIFEYIIKNKKSCSTEEIAKVSKFDLSTVQRAVKKLNTKGVIVRSQQNLENGGYIFLYQSKPRPIIKNIVMDIVNTWTGRVDEELDRW